MRKFQFGIGALLSLATLLLVTTPVLGLAVPPTPTDIPIVDQTNTLNAEQKATLAKLITDERTATGNQIAVLMIPSLQGDSLEDYSLNVARTWGIGQKEKNNGVLLLIVKDDRKMRIEVGYGLEGALPDIRANQIMTSRIRPEFKNDRYFEGIQSGLTGIIAAIHNEFDPALSSAASTAPKSWTNYIEPVLFALFFIPMWLGSILARSKSWWAGGVIGGVAGGVISLAAGFLFIGLLSIFGLIFIGLLFDWLVSRNFKQSSASGSSPSWWAGGGSFGGGSSGGGFGGGSFGGGGSSGSW